MNTEDLIKLLGHKALVSYKSDVKLSGGKKNSQQGLVTKLTENLFVSLTGPDGGYGQRIHETVDPDFIVKPRVWGKRLESGLIEHNGALYVEFIVEGRGKSSYLLDGQPIEKELIIGLPVTPPAPETGIILRCIKLSNMVSAVLLEPTE